MGTSDSSFVCTTDWDHSGYLELRSIGLTDVEAREGTLSGYTVEDYGISLLGTVQRFVSDGSPVIRPPVGYRSTSSDVFVEIEDDDRSFNPAGIDPGGTPLPGYDDHGWPVGASEPSEPPPTPTSGVPTKDVNGNYNATEVFDSGGPAPSSGEARDDYNDRVDAWLAGTPASEEIAAGDGGRWGLAALVVVAVLAIARRK